MRDGHFLTARVLRVDPIMLLVSFVAAILFLVITACGLNDDAGRPLDTDFFFNIYAAAWPP